MKRVKTDETILKIHEMLLERFGEPIGDNQGAPTSNKKKNMGNRGFGSQLSEDVCDQCGMMSPGLDQDHACAMAETDDLDEVTPPGEEKLVKSLKRQHGVKNPWALAWSIRNKK